MNAVDTNSEMDVGECLNAITIKFMCQGDNTDMSSVMRCMVVLPSLRWRASEKILPRIFSQSLSSDHVYVGDNSFCLHQGIRTLNRISNCSVENFVSSQTPFGN